MAVAKPERPYGECFRHDRDDRQRITQRLRVSEDVLRQRQRDRGESIRRGSCRAAGSACDLRAHLVGAPPGADPRPPGPIQEDCMKMSTARGPRTRPRVKAAGEMQGRSRAMAAMIAHRTYG